MTSADTHLKFCDSANPTPWQVLAARKYVALQICPSLCPLCDIWSICGSFTGPWIVTRLFFTA